MEFFELAKKRFAVRKFDSEKVLEDDKLQKILEAGRLAPTACNKQPYKAYVIKSREGLEKVRSVAKELYGAPVVVMMTYDKNVEWDNWLEANCKSGVQDVSIVATHMMMEATDLDVASIWINLFSPTEVHDAFKLPENEVVVMMLPLGYAAEDCSPHEWHYAKRPLEELTCYL